MHDEERARGPGRGEIMGERAMRLLLVNTVPTVRNGQTMFLLKYLRAMDRSGMDVGYVARNAVAPELRRQLTELGVRVYELPMRNRRPLVYLKRLTAVIREGGYDIVHANGNSATLFWELLAARLCGVRVRIAHSHNTFCVHQTAHRLLYWPMQWLTNYPMACGREAGRWLFGSRPFEIVPVASDPETYRYREDVRREARARMGLDGKIAVGCVAGFNAQKNHGFLLRAFARALRRNGDLRLILMGDGKLRPQIEAQIQELRLEQAVTLTGEVPDVPERLQAMDAMVLPSLAEGFPNVLVEWQLAGLPALVSDAVTRDCAMTDLLRYLPLDEEVWAEAMAGLTPVDRAAASRESARQVAARGYDVRAEAGKLKRRYREMLDEQGKRGGRR